MNLEDNVAEAPSGPPQDGSALVESPRAAKIYYREPEPPLPPQDLPDSDGMPLDSDWHRIAIDLLIDGVRWYWRDRKDYYAGGNMFVYFSRQQRKSEDYRGPDFFVVEGANPERVRRYWAIWDEGGKYPDFIMELQSPSTKDIDLTTKKDLYAQTFNTHEYCCYDPDTNTLLGWRLNRGQYEPITPNDRGWLWLSKLNMWVGIWQGQYQGVWALWPRFFDKDGNLVQTMAESECARADALAQEVARLKAQLDDKK